jgi:acyl-CoA reductase-like NAD-dependent aldehyde dehydrogenase
MPTETVNAIDHDLLLAGEWLQTGEWEEVASPYDGSAVGRVARGDATHVDRAAIAARAA